MASLQKFKLLATQCGVTQSPTISPRTSPIVHIRRRKSTLKMLLTRSCSSRRLSPRWQQIMQSQQKRAMQDMHEEKTKKENMGHNTLKDLFVSSLDGNESESKGKVARDESEQGSRVRASSGFGELGSPRPGWGMSFRYRGLLKRAWRPMLVTIPE